MKAFSLVALFIGILVLGGCQKKEANLNPDCIEEAKKILKKEFFKGTISKAELDGKVIFVVNNNENGAETILGDSCNRLYSCCGHACDCLTPIWVNKIKNKEVIWEIK
jgi:hypothetical protein